MKLTINDKQESKSVYFLLPLTLIPRTHFNKAEAIYALNSHKPELTNHVFVLFHKGKIDGDDLIRFEEYQTYEEIEYFGEYCLVSFKLPENFSKDHKNFLEGKYSKFSEHAKTAISIHYPFTYRQEGKLVESQIFKILFPTSKDRRELEEALGEKLAENCEIYDIPSLKEESFNINNFYKLFE